MRRLTLTSMMATAMALALGGVAGACRSATVEPATGERATVEPATGERATIEPATGERDIAAPASSEMELLGTAGHPIVMSFVPSGEMEEIVAGSDAVRDLLSTETGLEIETNVATSYAAVIEAMGARQAHVAWLPTLSYILAHERYGVEAILVVGRFGATTYASQILVRSDAGIHSLAGIAGKRFCRPDPLSTSGWVVPSVMLAAAGVQETDLAKVVDANGHDGVVTAVYNGDCDAGATWVDARSQVEDEFPDVKDVVVVLETSAAIPNDNVSVVPDLPPDTVARIRDGLMALAASEEGLEALGSVYGVETLEVADDSFYDAFRVTLDKSGIDVAELAED